MKKIIFSAISAAIIFSTYSMPAYCDRPVIQDVIPVNETVKQYEPYCANIRISAQYKNPFDPSEIDLTAEIVSPDGTISTIPLFYSGQKSIWKLRYSPLKAGEYSYKILLKSSHGFYFSYVRRFKVNAAASDGFLRKCAANTSYLSFDSGKPFFGVGHNIGWITNNNIKVYEKYFTIFRDSGLNLTRIWLNSPWTFRIETEKIGTYNMEDADKLDKLLAAAENYGVYIVLVLDSYSSLMNERGFWDEQSWKVNPYNKTNGGPCEKPWDFFTNEDAKRFYKNRLRYIIARWSHSPNILAFELWNEADSPADWMREMASYIRSINPHGTLVATSLGYPWGNNFNESAIWDLKEVDIIDRHLYGNTTNNIIENIVSINPELSKKYEKPIMVGEFGMDSDRNDAEIDNSGAGTALHSSLWASVMTRSFSTSLNWWWSEYVKAKNLYSHYKAIHNFVKDVKWGSRKTAFLKITAVKCDQNALCEFSDVTIKTNDAWGDMTYKKFTVENNGSLDGGAINSYLHGEAKEEFKISPVFSVNYPIPGKFILRLDMVSQGANLVISLDDKIVLEKALPAGPGAGPWKRSLYRKDHKIYQCIYDTDISIDVPEGSHKIQLFNTGSDWMRIKYIKLSNYSGSNFANAGSAGLRVGDELLLWIYSKEYTWKNVKKGANIPVIKGASCTIQDIDNGTYDIEWWDTFEGKVILRQKVTAEKNELKINVPDFSKDLACKAKKRGLDNEKI